ncbi:MAG: NUDIX hydrolase, partial [Clostridia bacterium]|nr:NUDIX hydrolase [Clostridia bacterium]
MELFEKTLAVKEIFKGKVFSVHVDDIELPDGSKSFREIVEHSGGVCVAAITDEDEMFFVRQFRYPYKRVLLELPAGKLEKGEDPLDAGKRELQEECGVTADTIIPMGTVYPTVAYCSEI